MAQTPDDEHYRMVAHRLMAGAVVPFLGAGVSRCGRPASAPWERGRYLPDGRELTEHLAQESEYPPNVPLDLLRVSQYFDVKLGIGPLYDALHRVFDADYLVTPTHRFLASLPEIVRRHRVAGFPLFPLYVTTNYDNVLEQALVNAGEEFDLITYVADGPNRGRFRHTRPDGSSAIIRQPNKNSEFTCAERPVVAKIHGAVSRQTTEQDSFVITENHYIAYLSHSDIFPVKVMSRMRQSHLLFLGYSLKDWNLRVILHRLWEGGEGRKATAWAIQGQPDKIEERAWYRRGVELLDCRLEEYTAALESAISARVPAVVSS